MRSAGWAHGKGESLSDGGGQQPARPDGKLVSALQQLCLLILCRIDRCRQPAWPRGRCLRCEGVWSRRRAIYQAAKDWQSLDGDPCRPCRPCRVSKVRERIIRLSHFPRVLGEPPGSLGELGRGAHRPPQRSCWGDPTCGPTGNQSPAPGLACALPSLVLVLPSHSLYQTCCGCDEFPVLD